MGITERIPGLRPDHPGRHLLIAGMGLLCLVGLIPVVAIGYLRYRGC